MNNIEINNLTTNFFDEEIIKKLVKDILNSESCKNCSISIVIVGPRRIKKLNKKYRHKNRTTDVLSFATKNDKENEFIDPINNLGEVVICPKYIKKNIKKQHNFDDNIFVKKFLETLIHGVLHLLGHDHKKKGDKQKMKKREDFLKNSFLKLGAK